MADNVIETGRSRIEDILLKASNGEALSRIEEILLTLYQDLVHLDDQGLIPASLLPPQVFEHCEVVLDDTARFALTTDDVQNGDLVYVNSSQTMYFVLDDTKLDMEAGYLPLAAGVAAKAIADENGNNIVNTYQTKLTFDTAPTANSTNPVTSGGVYTALENKQNSFVSLNSYTPAVKTYDGDVPSNYKDQVGSVIVVQFVGGPSYVPENACISLYNGTTNYSGNICYNDANITDNVIKQGEYCILLRKKFPSTAGYHLIAKSNSISDIIAISSRLTTAETAINGKQDAIDTTHKLSADLVDDSAATNKFATAAQLSQIGTNANNISTEQAKTTGMTEGGSNYITVGGKRVYVDSNPPTGARTGDLWIGG